MRKIDITTVLSQDLRSRAWVKDFYSYVLNSKVSELEIDFQNVHFATRSFIDEFYNEFIKNEQDMPFRVYLINVPEDIEKMLETVGRTQMRVKTIAPIHKVKQFKNTEELLQYMNHLSF